MDFAICLDQFSTNFNVSSLSPNGFSIYTDLDYTNPIASGIPYQDLFAPPIGNCPLIVDIPQGATQILVIDACATLPTNVAPIFGAGSSANSLITQCCYAIIPVPAQPISWCDTSGLEFDVFSSSYIGQIVAGDLISTLGTVTDYKIGWYLDGDYSSPIFTSGKGPAFTPYQFTHPLTGNSAVPALAGDWEGIIHDIAINGTTYSSVSGSANGTPIPFESCFDTIVVEPLSCDNGSVSSSVSKYSHHINFNSQAVGTTPAPVSLTYALSSTTKYFAYLFRGYNIWDELEIKFKSGNPAATTDPSLYSQPIYLEKLKIGFDAPNTPNTSFPLTTPLLPTPTNLNGGLGLNNVWPKSVKGNGSMMRTLALTTLETSSNPSFPDLLEITVTPNPSNNNTQWQAGFQCLDEFDCTDCTYEDYPNNLPKIWKLKLEKEYGCEKQKLIFYLTSSCLSSTQTSDWAGYAFSFDPLNDPDINLINAFTPPDWSTLVAPYSGWINLTPNISCQPTTTFNTTCGPSSTGQITLTKTFQQIQLTFNLESDYLHYKNSLINEYNTLSTQNTPTSLTSQIPCPAGSTNVNYYRYFLINVPIQGVNANCGDNTFPNQYFFHFNDYFDIQYVESPSTNTWSITIPQSLMVNCYPISSCDSCNSAITSYLITYNDNVNDVTLFSYTTNTGAKYADPIASSIMYRNSSSSPSGSSCYITLSSNKQYPWYNTHTTPFISSSTGWVNLYSLQTSVPCLPSASSAYPYVINANPLKTTYEGYRLGFQVRFPNLTSSFNYSLSTNDFEIYAFSGFGPTGSLNKTSGVFPQPCPDPNSAKIYSYINGVATVYTSSHFWQGNTPTLIIDP
jgi:hypothetical protein